MTIESHTVTHPDLRLMTRAHIIEQCTIADEVIERRLGRRPSLFAYPYGHCNDLARKVAQERYSAAFTTCLAYVENSCDPHAVPRIGSHYLRSPLVMRHLLGRAGRLYIATRGTLRAVRGASPDALRMATHEESHSRNCGSPSPVVDRQTTSSVGSHRYYEFPSGTVIIPAHNEARIIERALRPLAPLAADGQVEVIVACNGCSDATAELARSFAGVRVLNIPAPSKVAALNAADAAASRWPRLYLDADIEIDLRCIRDVFDALARGQVLAARPAFRYETAGASRLVRSYYRARVRIPSTNNALWGAGAFALTEQGHRRFGEFPMVSPRFSGDDLFVDQQFLPAEKAVLETAPVLVHTPRHADVLLSTLRRNYRAQAELRGRRTTLRTAQELIRSIRNLRSAIDAGVYAGFVTLARVRRRQAPDGAGVWERDESSRP